MTQTITILYENSDNCDHISYKWFHECRDAFVNEVAEGTSISKLKRSLTQQIHNGSSVESLTRI